MNDEKPTALQRANQYVRSHKVLVGLTFVFFIVSLVRYMRKIGDFEVYYAAAWRFLNGFSIHVLEPNMFTYPSTTAVMIAPLTVAGYAGAKIIFFLLGFVLMLVGIRLTNELLLPAVEADARTRRLVFVAALLCTGRYFLAVLDNQQTDLIIFGLITLGIYTYVNARRGTAFAWSIPVLLKANPAFMVLLPVFQGRLRIVAMFILLVFAGILIPDLLKPGPGTGEELTVPAHILPRDGVIGEKHFQLTPREDAANAYISEYLSMTLASEGPSWWEDVANPKNQSLTRILLYHAPVSLDGRVVFLALCLLFSAALFPLARKNTAGKELAVTALLFYSAFVLIGPVSSKPHFVMLYGLFCYAWLDVARNFSVTRLLPVAGVGLVVGFSSSGFLSDSADLLATWGHIGLASLALWIYVYMAAFRNAGASTTTL